MADVPTRALIVDDETDLCRLMQLTLIKMHIECDVAHTLKQAKDNLNEHDYQFCLTDLKLPDGSGLDLVSHINEYDENLPVAVITAFGSMDLAIDALKLGAFDFVNKPLELPRLRQLITNALKLSTSPTNQEATVDNVSEQTSYTTPLDSALIGESAPIIQLKQTIKKLARSQAPVFISGESGTGKEVVAQLIHELSPRSDHAFVPVNCGAIPSELMESEFFGHKKGSFTGATTDKQGLFHQANGGTLFLDEVADLPLAMQVKLLRAIQEKKVRAVGSTTELSVDVRLLSATHKNLAHLVEQGMFRQDLFYRINVIELSLPTLNQRGKDILLLANHFLTIIADEWQLEQVPELTTDAEQALLTHHYAGNVRELRNLLERAMTLSDANIIDVDDLALNSSQSDLSDEETVSDATSPIAVSYAFNPSDDDSQYQSSFNGTSSHVAATQFNTSVTNNDSHPLARLSAETSQDKTPESDSIDAQATLNKLPEDGGINAYLEAQEIALIKAALTQTNGNKTKAAELLHTSFRSLRYRMKKLNINDD